MHVPVRKLLASALLLSPTGAQGDPESCPLEVQQVIPPSSFTNTWGYVALDGDVAVLGTPNDTTLGPGAGSVQVYRRSGPGWVHEQTLWGADTGPYDLLGSSVAVEGGRIVAGAAQNEFTNVKGPGAVYVFEHGPAGWVETQKLAVAGSLGDAFGFRVALAGDLIAVSALGEDELLPVLLDTGAVYTFELEQGLWIEKQRLTAFDNQAFLRFGRGLATDGATLAVGTASATGLLPFDGAVYAYARDAAGTWVLEGKLIAPNSSVGGLGWDVDVEGDRLAAGAPESNELALDGGAVHLFERRAGAWTWETRLDPPDSMQGDFLGRTVSLDGERVAAGAPGRDEGGLFVGGKGIAFLFARVGGTWTSQPGFTGGDTVQSDDFGSGLALDGDRLFASAPGWDGAGFPPPGAGYLFDLVQPYASYGQGLAGSGGWRPELAGSGCPSFTTNGAVAVTGGLGGAPGVLALAAQPASAPFLGGELLVAPPAALFDHVLGGPGGAPGAGSFTLSVPIPSPGLAGVTAYFQAFYLDPGAASGVALSAGLALTVL